MRECFGEAGATAGQTCAQGCDRVVLSLTDRSKTKESSTDERRFAGAETQSLTGFGWLTEGRERLRELAMGGGARWEQL